MTRLANPNNVQCVLGCIALVMMALKFSFHSTLFAFIGNNYISGVYVPIQFFSCAFSIRILLSRFLSVCLNFFLVAFLPISATCRVAWAACIAFSVNENFNRRKLFERLFNLTNVAAAGYNRVWHDALLRSVLCLAPAYSRYAGAFILS